MDILLMLLKTINERLGKFMIASFLFCTLLIIYFHFSEREISKGLPVVFSGALIIFLYCFISWIVKIWKKIEKYRVRRNSVLNLPEDEKAVLLRFHKQGVEEMFLEYSRDVYELLYKSILSYGYIKKKGEVGGEYFKISKEYKKLIDHYLFKVV
jgi:hypothetical protein